MIMVSFLVAASISDAMPSLIPYFVPIMIVPQVFRISLPAFKPRRRCAGISSFNICGKISVLQSVYSPIPTLRGLCALRMQCCGSACMRYLCMGCIYKLIYFSLCASLSGSRFLCLLPLLFIRITSPLPRVLSFVAVRLPPFF